MQRACCDRSARPAWAVCRAQHLRAANHSRRDWADRDLRTAVGDHSRGDWDVRRRNRLEDRDAVSHPDDPIESGVRRHRIGQHLLSVDLPFVDDQKASLKVGA